MPRKKNVAYFPNSFYTKRPEAFMLYPCNIASRDRNRTFWNTARHPHRQNRQPRDVHEEYRSFVLKRGRGVREADKSFNIMTICPIQRNLCAERAASNGMRAGRAVVPQDAVPRRWQNWKQCSRRNGRRRRGNMESLTGNVNVAKMGKIWVQGNTARKTDFQKTVLVKHKIFMCLFYGRIQWSELCIAVRM